MIFPLERESGGAFHGMGVKGKLAKARCVQVRGGASQRCFLGREITVSRRGDIFWRDPPRVIFVYYSLCVCVWSV